MTNFARERSERRGPAAPRGSPLLDRLIARSLAMLAFERTWRVLIALLTLVGFFLAFSWAGLWIEIGRWGRILGVGAFAAAGLAVLIRGFLRKAPARQQALARLDASPGADHRLASSLDDTLAGKDHDPATAQLWALHRRRLEAKLRAVGVAPPSPRLADRDPFALRALALVAAIGASFAAGPERPARLFAAFDWGASAGGESPRIDAWLDPPAYTGRPPVVLSLRDAAVDSPLAAASPVNSTLIIRTAGDRAAIETSGALIALEGAREPAAVAQQHDRKFKLAGNARLTLWGASGPLVFDLAAIPDRPPTIELTQAPRNNARGSMTLAYRVDDDYGVIGAEAVVSRPIVAGKSVTGRSLVAPPRLSLSLPLSRAGIGEARSTLDVSDHPWAGARATMTLLARDEGGNEGLSAPVEITLPQRRFTKPLASALAEQRRNLVLDPDHQISRVRAALEALSLGPDLFQTPSSVYLGLSAAKSRLDGARGDDDLREVADMLWAMALGLETGNVSQAERDLRAAEKELREALARGASEEEISRLTDELRSALDNFLRGLAEQAARSGDLRLSQEAEGAQRSLTEQDLQSMLSEMEKAEKSGDLAQAQRLLDDLQDILENLLPSQAGESSAMAREMSRTLDELDRLSREQQQLRDDTHRGTPPGADARQESARPDRNEDGMDEMRARQQALRERLEQQQRRLQRMDEDAPQDLNDADRAMKDAENALGLGGEGKNKAVDAQGRALEALRRGADQLASRMQGEGEDGGEGRAVRPGRRQGMGQGGDDGDPLGRPSGRRRAYDTRARYDPLGMPPAMRAHRVLEELRRRLGQPERPAEELDYLQRLLRR